MSERYFEREFLLVTQKGVTVPYFSKKKYEKTQRPDRYYYYYY